MATAVWRWAHKPCTPLGEFFERTGICTEIFETGSVTLSNGRTTVDNLHQAVPFLEGTYSDNYNFDKPLPADARQGRE